MRSPTISGEQLEDVVREDAQLGADVGDPENVGVLFRRRERLVPHRGELRLVHERPLVAVGEPLDVEADQLAAVGNDVTAVAVDRGRRAEADEFPVADLAGADLRDDELPEEIARLLVEDHEHAAITGLGGVARGFVVGADVDAAAGDDGGAVGLRAELRDPADMLRRLRIDRLGLRDELAADDVVRDALGVGPHVAVGPAAPHRPVARLERGRRQTGRQKGERKTGAHA